jgi:hypothetical protein
MPFAPPPRAKEAPMRKLPLLVLATLPVAQALSCGGGGGDGMVVVVEEPLDFFEPCAADLECRVDTDCRSIAIDYGDVVVEDAMCTIECADDLDCPPDGICLSGLGGPPLCYQLCADDLDCPGGFACIEEVGEFSFAATCIPF